MLDSHLLLLGYSSVRDVTTSVGVVTARQFAFTTVGAGISLCGMAGLCDPSRDWENAEPRCPPGDDGRGTPPFHLPSAPGGQGRIDL